LSRLRRRRVCRRSRPRAGGIRHSPSVAANLSRRGLQLLRAEQAHAPGTLGMVHRRRDHPTSLPRRSREMPRQWGRTSRGRREFPAGLGPPRTPDRRRQGRYRDRLAWP